MSFSNLVVQWAQNGPVVEAGLVARAGIVQIREGGADELVNVRDAHGLLELDE